MIVSKITHGYVEQKFDTETRLMVSSEFTTGDDVDFEDSDGNTINPINGLYHPFNMANTDPDYIPEPIDGE